MPAWVVRYWDITLEEDEPRNACDYLDPKKHRGLTNSIGVNAPTFAEAVKYFDERHRIDEDVKIHSVEYIGPGISGVSCFFEADKKNESYDASLGFWRKAS